MCEMNFNSIIINLCTNESLLGAIIEGKCEDMYHRGRYSLCRDMAYPLVPYAASCLWSNENSGGHLCYVCLRRTTHNHPPCLDLLLILFKISAYWQGDSNSKVTYMRRPLVATMTILSLFSKIPMKFSISDELIHLS